MEEDMDPTPSQLFNPSKEKAFWAIQAFTLMIASYLIYAFSNHQDDQLLFLLIGFPIIPSLMWMRFIWLRIGCKMSEKGAIEKRAKGNALRSRDQKDKYDIEGSLTSKEGRIGSPDGGEYSPNERTPLLSMSTMEKYNTTTCAVDGLY